MPGDKLIDAQGVERISGHDGALVRFPVLIRTQGDERIAQVFERLIHAQASPIPVGTVRARVYLLELLVELVELGRAQVPRATTAIKQIIRHIDAHPERTDSLDQLARLTQVSQLGVSSEIGPIENAESAAYRTELAGVRNLG